MVQESRQADVSYVREWCFSADDIETVQQMFVQEFCLDGQNKFA
jgi:hypothetical protein